MFELINSVPIETVTFALAVAPPLSTVAIRKASLQNGFACSWFTLLCRPLLR